MSVISKRTIFVGPVDGANHKPLMVEGPKVGANAITPGMLAAHTGAALTRRATAATVFGTLPLVADRNALLQKTVDEDYETNGEVVYTIQPRSGEFLNVRVVTGSVLIKGTPLAANAAGQLAVAATDGTEDVIAYSDENVTTATAAPGELVRVRFA